VKVDQLKKMYPGTKIAIRPFVPDQGMLYFYERPYYIAIPAARLDDHEQWILSTLLDRETPPLLSKRSAVWYDLLFNGKPVRTDPSKRVRFILFHMNGGLSRQNLAEWRKALAAFSDPGTCFLYLSSKEGIIIEETFTLSADFLEAIANTLENDFSVKTFFQIGLRYPVSDLLPKTFREEERLFRKRLAGARPKEVMSVESGVFVLLKPLTESWGIFEELHREIADDPAWASLIRALWHNQGNISNAARQLFMHRNTLQYRIDKFYEQTGISLKRMDGLTVAYLSVL
jgi:hypothetical protein